MERIFQYSQFPKQYLVRIEKMFNYMMETGMYPRNEIEAFFEDKNQKKRIEIERIFYKKCICYYKYYHRCFYYKIDYTTEHLTCDFPPLSENEINNVFFEISEMTWLKHLSLKNLHGTLSESIGNLTKLEQLDLQLNQLEYLPESIGNLTDLERLDLSNNQLEFLPESIGNLTKLEHLVLYNNELTYLPESIGNLTNLKFLSIRNNKLESLPKNINKCVIIQ
jgi:hypothetical protein